MVDEVVPADIPFLAHVAPGKFVAAVGADSEEKSEVAPALLAASKVITDVTEQCAGAPEIVEVHNVVRG